MYREETVRDLSNQCDHFNTVETKLTDWVKLGEIIRALALIILNSFTFIQNNDKKYTMTINKSYITLFLLLLSRT